MVERRVVIRADASPAIGLGHVARCGALVHELVGFGVAVTWCGSGVPAGPVDHMDRGKVEVIEPRTATGAAEVVALDPDAVVVDGYHYTGELFEVLEAHGIPYAVVDDNAETTARRPALVVNQNPHADESLYDHLDGNPVLLLGIEHVMLRSEVVAAAAGGARERSGDVLVAFGGSDPRGLTEPAAITVARAGHPVRVALGAAHPDRAGVSARLAGADGVVVTQPEDYLSELATAGVAVLAGGTSLWEAAHLGTPVVAVVAADNQRAPAVAAHRRRLVADVLEVDELEDRLPGAVRRTLGTSGPPSVPAGGAGRVAAAIVRVAESRPTVRPATTADADYLFDLRTDPVVDRWSLGPAPTAEQHRDWLSATLSDPDRRLFVVEWRNRPIGQMRLDRTSESTRSAVGGAEEVSLALDADHRGRGLASAVLGRAIHRSGRELVARIHPGNRASIEVFARAGFRCVSNDDGVIEMRRGAAS